MPEHGPIYGIELLDTLPLDGGSMQQALPSRKDLDAIRKAKLIGSDRVVAGYEVLLEHYRRAKALADKLGAIVNENADVYVGERHYVKFGQGDRRGWVVYHKGVCEFHDDKMNPRYFPTFLDALAAVEQGGDHA